MRRAGGRAVRLCSRRADFETTCEQREYVEGTTRSALNFNTHTHATRTQPDARNNMIGAIRRDGRAGREEGRRTSKQAMHVVMQSVVTEASNSADDRFQEIPGRGRTAAVQHRLARRARCR